MLLALMLLFMQAAPIAGEWAGPMELTVESPQRVRGYIPTRVDIEQDGNTIKGAWRSLPPNTLSGTFTGTISGHDVTIRVLFYSDADADDGGVIPERCEADGDFSGRLANSGVIVLGAKQLFPDKRPKRECSAWPHDFVWVLQRH